MQNQDLTPLIAVRLEAITRIIRNRPVAVGELRGAIESLLVFLTSAEGRTDSNCQTVDFALMNDDELWEVIEDVESADAVLADVIRDMASTLRDTVSAPDIAANFDSTPEQLLSRLRQGLST